MIAKDAVRNAIQRIINYISQESSKGSSSYSKSSEFYSWLIKKCIEIIRLCNGMLARFDPTQCLIFSIDKSNNINTNINDNHGQVNIASNQTIINQTYNQTYVENQQVSNNDIDVNQNTSIQKITVDDPKQIGKLLTAIKKIVHKTYTKVEFDDSPYSRCAMLIDLYMCERFNVSNDPNHKLIWNLNYLSDYIYSIVYTYAKYEIEGEDFRYIEEFKSWIVEKVCSKDEKFSLDVLTSDVFFNGLLGKDINYLVDKDVLIRMVDIWTNLWKIGYHRFEDVDFGDLNSYLPDRCMESAYSILSRNK